MSRTMDGPDSEISREQLLGRALAAGVGVAATGLTAQRAEAAPARSGSPTVRRNLESANFKAKVPTINVAHASVQQIAIGELRPQSVSVAKLVLNNLHIGASSGAIQLKNLRVTVSVALSLDWSVSITIPIAGTFGFSGTIPLPTLSVTIPFGNLNLTGLQALSIDIASMQANNLSVLIPSLRNLQLGALVADTIKAQGFVAPTTDATVTGVGFGSIVLDGLAIPTGAVQAVTVAHVAGGTLPISSVTIPSITIPQTGVGSLTTNGIDTTATANRSDFHANASVLSVTLHVTPSARIRMDQMAVSNLTASGSIGSIQLQNVSFPFDLFDLKLSQLGIETLAIPHLEVS